MAGFCIVARQHGHDAFIAALAERAFAEYAKGSGAHTLKLSQRAGALTLVALGAGEPVGFAVMQRYGHAGHLDAIAVVEAVRGTGVGRRLLAQVEHEANRRGLAELGLVTAQANLAALELFVKAGFQLRERLPRFYATGHDAVSMFKQLG